MSASVTPEFLEPRRRKLSVPDRVLNVLVPEIGLERAGVMARVRESEPASVSEHVGVYLDRQASGNRRSLHHASKARRSERRLALRHKDKGRRSALTLQSAQGSQLIATDGMNARRSLFDTANVKRRGREVHLIPAKVAQLRRSQAMVIGDHDHRRVAMPVSVLACGFNQSPNLVSREVFACPQFAVLGTLRRDCSVFSGRRARLDNRFRHDFRASNVAHCFKNGPYTNSDRDYICTRSRATSRLICVRYDIYGIAISPMAIGFLARHLCFASPSFSNSLLSGCVSEKTGVWVPAPLDRVAYPISTAWLCAEEKFKNSGAMQ